MPILEVNNLKKVYVQRLGGNHVQALADVTFSVEEGECIASWAVPSASALQSAGLELTPLADGTLTRRECAELLYQLATLCQQDVLENFRWDSYVLSEAIQNGSPRGEPF